MDGANNPSPLAKDQGPLRGGLFAYGQKTPRTRARLTRHVPSLAHRPISCTDVRFGIHAFAVTNLSGINWTACSAGPVARSAEAHPAPLSCC